MSLQEYFYSLVDHGCSELAPDEVLLVNLQAESSDFVRFNQSAVRQAGHVDQAYIRIELIRGMKHAAITATLEQNPEGDRKKIQRLIRSLRNTLKAVPEDPYLNYSREVQSTEKFFPNELPDRAELLNSVLSAAKGQDMVGVLALGGISAGFGNSLGQRNWYSTYNFNLTWSFYHSGDKAVKASYSDTRWNEDTFRSKVKQASEKLSFLSLPKKSLKPGRYRVYLEPRAVRDIFELLCWDGFSLKAHKTKTTPFLKLIQGEAKLSPLVNLSENNSAGFAPNFQEQGFLRPERIDLIVKGMWKDCLVSPRSAKEYSVETNGANASESPLSLEMNGGTLAREKILDQLQEGLYVGNTWYLNYSDRPGGRITGMTRFATFWVEQGKIKAPAEVMRFDETIYNFLGEKLIDLTTQCEFMPDESTYGSRSTASMRLPGLLVEDFTFTL